ncbi:RNA helicase [Vibrio vulnificus]|uniref:DEAD/DEAH box helicase n=1 Tax=Vibrio vulnificus TaxID=672 RepID=UPI0006AD4CA6|nr:DEAD/DEAH box helicase [Vibrio vulnificus]KOR96767.1 RNA helicase [Vibrio vulnificus]MCG6274041.1 DEAD/DEAH box helicase [Vibrio vulnificus]HDY8065386.1 DEAD/DEAH box helicase [Vibrio vulnificus]
MSTIALKLGKNILSHQGFEQDRNNVFAQYVEQLAGNKPHLDRSLVKRLSTSIQVFHKSEDEKLKKEATALLAMLLDIAGDDYPDLIPIAKNIFINSGDFPNVSLLDKRHPNVYMDYGFNTSTKFELKAEMNSVEELSFPLTDFQRMLWSDLDSDNDVITIAPTSAGKTHIILTYLVNKIVKSNGAFAAIVVPTRALISEVSSKVFEIAKGIDAENELEICSVPKDEEFSTKTVFVMTQERLYELIQRGDLSFDYLFIDEAHNISDDGRGVLLHLTLEKILDDSSPQIIVSMPSDSYQNAFSAVFSGVEFQKEITRHSPVAKLLLAVELKGKNIEVQRYNTSDKAIIPKNFTGRKTADVVLRLGQGQSNIIYRNQTNQCENTAKDIADLILEYDTPPALEEAADYIEQFIHNDFTLASSLRKGVAFHYGPLPSSVRVMVENLVKAGDIKFIVCTSTLAEGVNLPAKNLFLTNPFRPIRAQQPEKLEEVKINNITGRAGRMVEHFSGNVFLLNHDSWKYQDYFEENDVKEEKIPTYYKTLNEELSLVVSALQGNYPHDKEGQYRFYTIANKLIRELENGSLDERLDAEELQLSSFERDYLVKHVEIARNALRIAPFILEANPTIGYIQQNNLSLFFDSLDNYDDWVLPHPKSKDLYSSIVRVTQKLYELGVYTNGDGYSIGHVSVVATKWVAGKSLKEIISEQIAWDRKVSATANVNQSVRNVIKIINNDITFRLRNALSCYHVLLTNSMKLKGIDKASVKLHTYLELGACDDRMINLINFGLSREAAKEIQESIPKSIEVKSIYDLLTLLERGLLSNTHPVTQKEVKFLLSQ